MVFFALEAVLSQRRKLQRIVGSLLAPSLSIATRANRGIGSQMPQPTKNKDAGCSNRVPRPNNLGYRRDRHVQHHHNRMGVSQMNFSCIFELILSILVLSRTVEGPLASCEAVSSPLVFACTRLYISIFLLRRQPSARSL